MTPIRTEQDVVLARQAAKALAGEMGFDLLAQAYIATCVSELTRNVIQYAKEGSLTITQVQDRGRTGLEFVCADEGPGIPDVEAAMLGVRQANGQGLGLGLRGAKRLMDEFQIHSVVGKGTVVRCRKWLDEAMHGRSLRPEQ